MLLVRDRTNSSVLLVRDRTNSSVLLVRDRTNSSVLLVRDRTNSSVLLVRERTNSSVLLVRDRTNSNRELCNVITSYVSYVTFTLFCSLSYVERNNNNDDIPYSSKFLWSEIFVIHAILP